MSDAIRIGTCGFGRTRRNQYASSLPCVEIQHTFYHPPQVKTLEKWRSAMPADFEFTLKAWQFITHEGGTPTYKRLDRPLTSEEEVQVGGFKPTNAVREGWNTTLASAQALKARTVLFQCPAKFKQNAENIKNLRRFFKKIERRDLNFAWEPRGPWEDKIVKKICNDLDLWHVVDPFKARTVTPDRCYYRLHGIRGWRYKYEEGELEELVSLLPKKSLAYVFFNNREMFDDALRFQNIVKKAK